MLLESYFTLNKEQRYKFLTKEERSELRKAKRERKEKGEKVEEEIEEEIVEKSEKKKDKKNKKEKKIVEEQIQEEDQEEVETPVKKSKKDKKSKKEKKQKQEVQEAQQEQESDQEKKIKQKKVKTEKNSSNNQQDNEDSTSSSNFENNNTYQKITKSEAEQWRKDNELTISGKNCESSDFYPIITLKNTGMPDNIMQMTKDFQKPTLIQSAGWPIVLHDRDCIAIAETGSGKTLGFLLPAFNHILKTTSHIQSAKNPRVIIVSPTRELATQIYDVSVQGEKFTGIKSVCLYGGVSKSDQKQMLKQGVQVIIATPGRLKDLLQEGAVNTKDVSMIVLDEADRMLDLGFKPDITYIYSQVKKDRRSVMFSATWPKDVQDISAEFLVDPVMIKIGTEEGSANKRVSQTVEVIQPFARNKRLLELLKEYSVNNEKIIVFVLYKVEAARIEEFIRRNGYKVSALHGDMSQKARNLSFQQFKDNEVQILVATDVAARGLDIPNVEHVINYSFPLVVSDYVHRIGRTGRAGKSGNSYTFFQEKENKNLAGDLCEILKEAGQPVPKDLEAFGPSIHKQEVHPLYGNHFKKVDMSKKPVKTLL